MKDNKTIGFYPGSFDPFTNGHLAVIKKASKLFDEVIVAIGENPSKSRRIDKYDMIDAIGSVLLREGLTNVFITSYKGLLAEEAKNCHADYIIRGIRNNIDYNYEETLAGINQELTDIDTIYIRAGNLGNVSSSMVMELVKYDYKISDYVPREVEKLINEKI